MYGSPDGGSPTHRNPLPVMTKENDHPMAKDLTALEQATMRKADRTPDHKATFSEQDIAIAAANFIAGSEPVVKEFCRIPYFRNSLGEMEICSIANTKLIEFFMETKPLPDDKATPYLLKRILYNELVNNVHRHETRCKYHQPHREEKGQADTDGVTLQDLLPADSSCEPEARILQAELSQDLEEALRRLKPLEQEVLRGLYYEGKRSKALAEKLKITPQYVSHLKKHGLARLRILLKAKYPEKDMLV